MEYTTTPVEGGWHARDADTGLTYFGESQEEAVARLQAAKAIFVELRRRAREERQAALKGLPA